LKQPASKKQDMGTEPTSFFATFKDILHRALFMMSGLVLMNIMDVISIYYIGWLNDTTMLAGVGLGIVIMNIVIVSILQGSIRGMEKLIQTSIEKEDDIEQMCKYMARGRAILIALWIPLAAFLYFCYPVLLLIKQNPDVAKIAVNYIRFALVGILFKANFDYLRRYILKHKMSK
jgi:multidrug resistance protein, MATE family